MQPQLSPTEQHNITSRGLDAMTTFNMLHVFHAADQEAVEAVSQALPQLAIVVDSVAERMKRGGRLIYLGAGTSGRLGVLDASEIPPTFSAQPDQVIGIIAGGDKALRTPVEGVEDNPAQAVADLEPLDLSVNDTLVGISANGNAPYVLSGLEYAGSQGALTVALTCNPEAATLDLATLRILCTTGPEVISGSTRLKAGTATKMLLNILSSAVMVKLGRTYGNLMVEVQATNRKLKSRALRLVMEIADVDETTAQSALDACNGHVKKALIHLMRDVTPEQAEKLLAGANGQLRLALTQEEN